MTPFSYLFNRVLIICMLLLQFNIFPVVTQSPCDDSNAQCSFIYHDSHCMYYNGEYVEISNQSQETIASKCTLHWESLYNPSEIDSRCSSTQEFIWPVGYCGCPECGCNSSSFCCYDSPNTFDINNWQNNVFHKECDDGQNMCCYTINAYNMSTVSCCDAFSLNTILSMNVTSPSSTILDENNNTACYTFIESNNSTKLSCFCTESGCNALSNIIAPDLQPKKGCYVSNTFHNELFWSNYVYEDYSCEMCSVAMVQSSDGTRVDFACKSRASCYTLLTEYDAYNDALSGCVSTSSTTTECCCDPSIDGDLCNKQFVTSSGSASRSYFGCWKADFITVPDYKSDWNSMAKRVNCSAEMYQFCVIQSFGNNRYSSTCEKKSNCDKLEGLVNNKRMCCNDTEFCNEPSIFYGSSAINHVCWAMFCVFFAFLLV